MLPSPLPLLQTAPPTPSEPSLTLRAKNKGEGAEKAAKRKRSQGCPLAWATPGQVACCLLGFQPVLPKRRNLGAPGRQDASGLPSRPCPTMRPRPPLLRGVGPDCPGKKSVGASASPRPSPASRPPPPGPLSKPLPAGRGSLLCPRLGSRRSARSPWRRAISVVGLGSALLPAPRAPSAPLLRVALGTWHSLPPESRAALPAGRWSPRQPGPLRRRRQRHLPRATRRGLRRHAGREGGKPGAEGGVRPTYARERAEIRFIRPRYLATGPWAWQDSSRRVPAVPKEQLLDCSSPWWPEAGKGLLLKRIGPDAITGSS